MPLEVYEIQVPAKGLILLDYNGYSGEQPIWEDNTTFDGSALMDWQKTEVQSQVAHIFNMWDVVVTTDDSLFWHWEPRHRVRCVITFDRLSEIAFYVAVFPIKRELAGRAHAIGSIAKADTLPVVVSSSGLNYNPKMIAYCIAHEIGHALGLLHIPDHDLRGNITNEYGSGTNPYHSIIMGNFSNGSLYSTWTEAVNTAGYLQNDTLGISQTFRRLTPQELNFINKFW